MCLSIVFSFDPIVSYYLSSDQLMESNDVFDKYTFLWASQVAQW